MDPVSIVIGIAAGAVLGGGAGMMMSGKAKLQKELEDANAERDKAQKALKSGEKKAEDAAKKAKDLEKKLEKSKKSIKDAEAAKKKKEEEAKSTKKALEKAEGKAKQLASKAKDAESKASELKKTAAEQEKAVDQLKKDLAAAGGPEAAKYDAVAGNLDGILKVLCEHEGQEAAVLADANGIVVAAFGNAEVKEGMAAAASRITKISDQLRGIVDFGTVSAFRIGDTAEHVIAGRTVDVHGERVALATVGSKVPSDGSLDGAIENLHSALS